jgi:hypothetical protein
MVTGRQTREKSVMGNQDEPVLNNEAPPSNGNKSGMRRKGMRVATTAGMALGLTVGGAAVAGAATSGTRTTHASHSGKWSSKGQVRPAVFGTVATVGVNTFTVTTHEGSSVVVDVTTATTYRDRDVSSASFANVKAGEMVAVFGTKTSNTVSATSVGIGTRGGRGGRG